MHKKLIIDAFKKAEKVLINKGVNAPSKRQNSIELSTYLSDEYGFPFGDRSLRDYYDAAVASEDFNISNISVVEGLCAYLGHESYSAYTSNLDKTGIDRPLPEKSKRQKRTITIIILISVLLLIGTFAVINATKQQWMIWQEDHYEVVSFDREELSKGNLKIYKEDRILNFRKLKNPDCEFDYFNEDGTVNVWYGKNKEGELEIFTDLGLHPETGKTLKPITDYMIRKYLCDLY